LLAYPGCPEEAQYTDALSDYKIQLAICTSTNLQSRLLALEAYRNWTSESSISLNKKEIKKEMELKAHETYLLNSQLFRNLGNICKCHNNIKVSQTFFFFLLICALQ